MSALQAASPEPVLLERQDEVEELTSLVAGAADGEGRTLLIEAAAGLGKTRLLEAVRNRATRRGMRVLAARGIELEREFTYGVVRQLLEPALAACDEDERSALLDGAAAPARRVLGGADGPPPSPSSDLSFSTLYGLYWLMANLSQAGPLLLVVDDAHWGDAPSLQFLRFMTPRLDGLPVLLALAARPADPDSLVTSIGTDPSTLVMSPGPLGTGSVARVLTDALGVPPDDAFCAACHEVTGGNPFLLTELSRNLAAEGVQPTAAHTPALGELVPDTIVRSVLRRLAPLTDDAQAVARAVAILGDGCELRHVAALAGLELDGVADAADELRAAGILAPESGLRFIHPLVGSAVYADVPAGARSREHARAAALLDADRRPAERVAAHLLLVDPAGDPWVVDMLRRAAQAALDQGASQPATAYLRRALEEPPSDEIRLDLLELLNTARMRSADRSIVTQLEDELLDELRHDPARLMRCAEGLALGLIVTGRIDDGANLLERAIAAAEAAGDLGLAVALETQLILFKQLPPAEAHSRLRRYERRLAEGSTEQRLILALSTWAVGYGGGRACDAAALGRRAFAADAPFDDQLDSVAWPIAIVMLIDADELQAAGEAADELVRVATRRGATVQLAVGWFSRGAAAFYHGDLHSAEADIRQAIELGRLRGFLGQIPGFTAMALDLMVARDELDAAERELHALGFADQVPDGYWFWPVLLTRGRLRLAQGRVREAADDLLELRARMAAWGVDFVPRVPVGAYAARALSLLGDEDRALSLADEHLVAARRWGAPSAVAEGTMALGVVAGGRRGSELLEDAVELLRNEPRRLLYATALTELGTLLRRERRRADSRGPLREALQLARRCGGVAVARRAAEELEATGEKVPRYTPIGVDTLTPSERRVAEMASRGMMNREIAAALYVTIKTVESHLRAAYDKLGVPSRQELGAAIERG
jgi:DNA-binding CsgD family transcriptional regulator